MADGDARPSTPEDMADFLEQHLKNGGEITQFYDSKISEETQPWAKFIPCPKTSI